ncbi:MAG: hypothetical protein WCO28_02015 [Bacteroidota bacterium]
MKSASISDIKKELQTLSPSEVMQYCMRLAKYKKDNKELLNYLLFEAHDEEDFIKNMKQEIDLQFAEMNTSNTYLAKKSLRKILRITNKHIKFSGHAQTAAELLIYFCASLKSSGIPINTSTALSNLYQMQLKKINKIIETMHEDLQYDYRKDLEELN